MVKRIMEEIKKAIQEGVTSHPEAGIVGVDLTPTDRCILVLILALGTRQNLRNDNDIIITADDVRDYYPLSMVDNCVYGLRGHPGYVNYCWYDLITYYYPTDNAIYIQSPYLHALYHYIAAQRDTDAPYADLADRLEMYCVLQYEKLLETRKG